MTGPSAPIAIDIAALAREQGFARAAIVPIEAPRRHALYTSWLAAGHAGEMAYLAEPAHVGPRGDLRALLGDARALIVVALAYERADPIPADRLLRGTIARYARGEDYHLVLRDKLVALADRLQAVLGRPVATRPCVDSAPVLEREWAERGGLGFVAKNTMLIAPGLGSYVVLGELLVDVDLAPTSAEPTAPRCGTCHACIDACPTQAFPEAFVLDARRCISYLTIEHRGPIPVALRPAIGTWVFGCDRCQEVCPFNAGKVKAGDPPIDPLLQPRSVEHALPDLVALATLGANQLRQRTRRTAMRRISRDQLQRNVAVALGNVTDPRALPPLRTLLAHRDPQVRAHAAWALGRHGARAELEAALATETDADVRAEIAAGLST